MKKLLFGLALLFICIEIVFVQSEERACAKVDPQFVKEYIVYYRNRERGFHPRSQGEGLGWNVTGYQSYFNMPILKYSNEIRSAVLMIHGEKAHSCYFSKDAYANMIKDNPYKNNKELLLIPHAVHTDLYDNAKIIPFDKIEAFFKQNLTKK
jgi:hypothetical protein